MIGIYRIFNMITGLSYIGQSKDIEKRWEQHDKMLMEDKHHSKKLQADFNIYGPNAFMKVILKTFPVWDEALLDKEERMFITFFNSFHRGYNCTSGNTPGSGVSKTGGYSYGNKKRGYFRGKKRG